MKTHLKVMDDSGYPGVLCSKMLGIVKATFTKTKVDCKNCLRKMKRKKK